MYYYSFTLRKVRGKTKLSILRRYLLDLRHKLNDSHDIRFMNVCYEDDEGLHLHAMILSPKRLSRKDVKLYKHGWSIRIEHLKTMKDIGVWTFYCSKHIHDDIEKKHEVLEYAEDYADDNTENAVNGSAESNQDSGLSIIFPDPPIQEDLTPSDLSKRNFDIRKVVESIRNRIS